MLTTLLLVAAAQATPPALSINAVNPATRCPTDFTGSVRGATPGGDVAFVSGASGARSQIPAGMTCAGTVLSLGNPVLRLTQPADRAGSTSVTRPIPQAGCGLAVQVVDLTTCTVSNVELIQ